MVDFNVDGKVAVVTGGSRGLGYACAEILLLGGASKVFITSRKEKACMAAVEKLNKTAKRNGKKGSAEAIVSDLSTFKGCKKLLEEFSKRQSKCHSLISNAGATWGESLETHPESALQKVLSLNVIGVFHCIQLFAPILAKSGSSVDPARCLVMSSIAGKVTSFNLNSGTYGYYSSKAAVTHLGKNLAIELGPQNINVNVLEPGFFPSKMSQGVLSVVGDSMALNNPRKRLGVMEDLQYLVLFLCAKQSNYINGVAIPIDGGACLVGTPLAKL